MGETNARQSRFISRFKTAFSPASPGSGSAESAAGSEPVSDKRREQVRRAQKAHRERKIQHTNRLQAEIADLRSKDATKTAQIKHQQKVIHHLTTILDQYQIPYSTPEFHQGESPARISVISDNRGSSTRQLPLQSLQVGMPLELINSNLLFDAQTGIDFVLALEQPCLYHHHNPPADNDDAILGHSAMMQATIMARGPDLADSKDPHLPEPFSWTVPSEELESLLHFSNQIRLPNEITPVQVWSQIRELASSGWSPTRETLDAIILALAQHCACFGFGAVLDKHTFNHVLQPYTQQYIQQS